MIRQVIRGLTLRRDGFLRAVLGRNGVADAVVIVAAVYLTLSLTIGVRGVGDLIGHARFVLNGGFAWVILSGLVYLIARYAMDGEGSFQGMLAATGLAAPALLVLAIAQIAEPVPLAFFAHPTLLLPEVFRFGFATAAGIAVAVGWFLAILAAATRVAMSLPMERAALTVGGGYLGWWIIGTLFGF
jgi:hypothetical protein